MRKLIRLIYVSQACFDVDCESGDIEPEVIDILNTARVHNKEKNIGGVLYFGEGYFFQCLEGNQTLIYDLMDKVRQDPRHQHIKISYCKRVRRRVFKNWSMKYVPVGENVKTLMNERGYKKFDPVRFDESDVNAVINLFLHAEDTSLKNETLREAYFLKPAWWRRLLGLELTHS